MQGEQKERWMELCERAANEQDSEQLMKLVQEINELLEAKEKRISAKAANLAPEGAGADAKI